MCGVVGAAGDATRDVERLLLGVAHRGPDVARTFASGGVAVGGARLRLVGDASADQPLVDGPIAAAWNGEAFNLVRGDAADSPKGDLGAVVAAFRSKGVAAFADVRGPFAAVFADVVERRLVVARDPLGVRPLYVRRSKDGVRVASEAWPLIESLGSDLRFDPVSVAFLTAFQFPPVDRGLVEGVDPSPPGLARTFEPDGAGGARESAAVAVAYRGEAEADVASALRAAAALQAPCAKKTGIFLSGGIDSSAVLGLLAAVGRKPDVAFVGWFPDGDASLDERPHARAAAAEFGVPLVEVPIDADAALAAAAPTMRGLGGPCGGPGALASFVLAKAARREGVDVVFTGQGGDEYFGGYERHRILAAIERGDDRRGDPTYAPLEEAMRAAADPWRRSVVRGDAVADLLEPEALSLMRAAAAAATPPQGRGRVDAALKFERRVFLPGLFAVDDRALGAFGIEGRVPLADPVVARLASAVPYDVKCPADSPRRLLREAVGDAAPRASRVRRDKMGFPMPLDVWFEGPWRGFATDAFSGDALVAFGFRRGAARAAFEAGRLSPRDAWFLLAAAVFETEIASVRSASTASSVVAGVSAGSAS
jgi:asparagine synthase (glutamine-hydrolysing)